MNGDFTGFITDKYPKFKFAIDMVFLGLFFVLIISAQSAYNMGLSSGIRYCMSRCALCPADMNEDISIPNVCKCENETIKDGISVENLSFPFR